MKTIKYFLLLGLFFSVNGCTSTTMVPPIGELQTIITNANTEAEAIRIANIQARRACNVYNQTLKIIDLDTVYQGVDPAQKALIKLAENVLPSGKTYKPYTPDGYTYKATITFKCV
jgi:hypothetical protein